MSNLIKREKFKRRESLKMQKNEICSYAGGLQRIAAIRLIVEPGSR